MPAEAHRGEGTRRTDIPFSIGGGSRAKTSGLESWLQDAPCDALCGCCKEHPELIAPSQTQPQELFLYRQHIASDPGLGHIDHGGSLMLGKHGGHHCICLLNRSLGASAVTRPSTEFNQGRTLLDLKTISYNHIMGSTFRVCSCLFSV